MSKCGLILLYDDESDPPRQANARPFAVRALGICSRNIETIAKPVSTLEGHLNVRPGTGAIAPGHL